MADRHKSSFGGQENEATHQVKNTLKIKKLTFTLPVKLNPSLMA